MKKNLLKYITKTTNWNIKKIKAYDKESITLPIHIFYKFELVQYSFEELEVLCLFPKDRHYDIKQLTKYIELITKVIDIPIVFIFQDLEFHFIQSMINKKINFIILDKYIFLPFVLIQIKTKDMKIPIQTIPIKLDNISKVILIGYLSDKIDSAVSGVEIAKQLDKQPIVISKALHQLEQLGYLHFQKLGRQKLVYFKEKEEVWDSFKKEFTTPIKEVLYAVNSIDEDLCVTSGITALSKYSALNEGNSKTIAIYKRDLKAIKNELTFVQKEEEILSDKLKIEVWDIDPKLLAIDGMVNPLYLYINFLHQEDERVQIALDEMIGNDSSLKFLTKDRDG